MLTSMATTKELELFTISSVCDLEKKNKLLIETVKEVAAISKSEAQPEKSDVVWEQMNKGVSIKQDVQQKGSSIIENGTNDEVKRLTTAALSVVRMLQQLLQRYETLWVEIEVKKLVDVASEEASERAKGLAGTTSATEHNKGLEEELDAYKISDQYVEKASLLQRADYREFERERDAQLPLQARRKARYERGSMKVIPWFASFFFLIFFYFCCL
ncbi:hypothetical protein PVL29_002498 [Vitis rotundifolia]|uniref:BCNT-C domain-containing protein n=1 Tax=Vitis rotundifolia TaxID=103349 RepID=A0AA39AI72_VITRO|nr:hypothetical protein PVL29_002498 [Vitis rotundifolia]